MGSWLTNEGSGDCHNLTSVELVGRDRSCQIHLPDSRVSRQHAMLRREVDGAVCLYDLGSSNGSFVNQRRINRMHRLADGDLVQIGPFGFRFHNDGDRRTGSEKETFTQMTLAEIRTTPVVILVSDIVDFTPIAERLPPVQLAKLLSGWYGLVQGILTKSGAILDKFVGDAFLACWMEVTPSACRRALGAVKAIHDRCSELCHEQEAILKPLGVHLRSGFALHVGNIACGSVPSSSSTMLGDAVNTAFRLESLTRELGKQVLVSGEFVDAWEECARYTIPEGSRHLKGKSKPLEVFSVARFPE